LSAPLAITDEKGTSWTHFRLTPEHAERCTLILVAEQSKPTEPRFALHHAARLAGYISAGQGK
jgi:hypothetical protein